MAMFQSITVALPVFSLEQAVDWYRKLLGAVEEMNPAPGVWEFQLTSSAWLQLFELEPGSPNPAVLRLEVDDVGASHELALRLETEVGAIETVPGVIRYFEFTDPFGNQLSFYELLG